MTMAARLLLLLLFSPLVLCSGCDESWCDLNCPEEKVCGDEACWVHPLCEERGCPCPLYMESELNISVSCSTSQSVMDYNLSNLFNISLDTSQLSVSISMQQQVI